MVNVMTGGAVLNRKFFIMKVPFWHFLLLRQVIGRLKELV